ncbi:hypothetical protein [Flocculibacter collagenilyticus]|uniref:hypothetical protein n=1 Tax=Flocculibacter collagenilyticus TaxID=2744479 RepID=UPI0018F75AD8|nr:hypothetical protein [Flocculibacter collagenilyticus]
MVQHDLYGQQQHLWHDKYEQLRYAQLCNALYQRELFSLINDPNLNHLSLKKRCASLPHYVKRAAETLLNIETPLQLDSENASWFAKQSKHCPSTKQTSDVVSQFYQHHAVLAMIVPLSVVDHGTETIALDSVDQIAKDGTRIHLNQYGWFKTDNCLAKPLIDETSDAQINSTQVRLLKPVKAILTAACCGHRWNNQLKTSPRALTLRELLLTTRINWKTPSKPLKLVN